MEATVLINKINILPNSLKEEVNDFVDFLISKKVRKDNNNTGELFGIWTREEADEIEKIIKEGTEKIDNEW